MRVIVGREGLFKTIFVNPGCREFDLRHQSRLIRYQLIERILNRLKQAPLAIIFLGFAGSFSCGFGWFGGGLLGGALVVEGQQAFEDFLAGGGDDGVADAVVFCQGFHLVEVVAYEGSAVRVQGRARVPFVVDRHSLQATEAVNNDGLIALAVFFDKARLIDNIELIRSQP